MTKAEINASTDEMKMFINRMIITKNFSSECVKLTRCISG